MKPLRWKKYIEFLRLATDVANKFPTWMTGERLAATKKHEKLMSTPESEHPGLDERITAAVKALKSGDNSMAEDIASDIIAENQGVWPAYMVLAEALVRRGDVSEAIGFADAAYKLHPDRPDVLVARAIALEGLRHTREAVDVLDRALDIRVNHTIAQNMLSRLLAKLNDSTPRHSVTVVTATIGSEHLRQTMASVQRQDYPFVSHLLMIDGPQYQAAAMDTIRQFHSTPQRPIDVMTTPYNVGSNDYICHKLYAISTYVVRSRYLLFLDDDNWIGPDHISTLMALVTSRGLPWAYSPRNIVDESGQFICHDDCESLGDWPTWHRPGVHMVDQNCFILRTDLAVLLSPMFYRRCRDEESPDYLITRELLGQKMNHGCTGRYSVNYREGSSPLSVRADFFLEGNKHSLARHGDPPPWRGELVR